MVGAFVLDFWESRAVVADHTGIIAIGFVVSFLSGLVIVRALIDFVGRHGFSPFAWWRIAIGALGLLALAATGAI